MGQRNLETGNWDSWQPYAAQRGEQAAAIARRFGVSLAQHYDVSLAQLKTWNPAIGKRGLIRAGQRLVVRAP